MAVPKREKFTQEKIDQLFDYLKTYHEMGQALDYEIMVDGFKAVRRTDNPDMFPLFEKFVIGDSKYIEVIIYQGTSNNNEKKLFVLQEESQDTGLSGIEIDSRIKAGVAEEKNKWEFEQLKKDNKEWEDYAKELEEEIDKLEKEVEGTKAAQSPLHGFLGEFGSSLVSGMIRQNPGIAQKIPGLAGLMEPAGKENLPAPGSDISFSSAEAEEDPESKESVSFVRKIKTHFPGEKFDKLMKVIDLLSAESAKIDVVINYLTNKENGSI